jgi:hypothetical protein
MKHVSKKKISGERGLTVINLIFIITGLLALTVIILLIARPIFVLRQQAAPINGLHLISAYMRSCVLRTSSWSATVADPENKSLQCLRDGSDCNIKTIQPPFSYLKLKASAAPKDLCFQNYNTMPGTSTDGFTEAGTSCTGFSDQGNAACPYRFNVYWQAECPDGAQVCKNPVVRVNGDLVRGSRDPQAQTDKEVARFALRTVRGRSDRTRYFTLAEVVPAGKTAFFAPCNLQGNLRLFNRGFDSGGYVEFQKNGTIEFAPGTYSCRISVPGYRVGNFKTLLLDMTKPPGTPVLMGTSEYSALNGGYAQTRSEIVGTFKLRAKTQLAVVQICSASSGPQSESLNSMGVPMNIGKDFAEIYSTMECRVL